MRGNISFGLKISLVTRIIVLVQISSARRIPNPCFCLIYGRGNRRGIRWECTWCGGDSLDKFYKLSTIHHSEQRIAHLLVQKIVGFGNFQFNGPQVFLRELAWITGNAGRKIGCKLVVGTGAVYCFDCFNVRGFLDPWKL